MIGYHIHRVQIIVGGLVLLILAGAVHQIWSLMTTIKKIQITIDPNFSPLCDSLMREKLTYEAIHTEKQRALLSTMHTHFHCIDTIDSHVYAPGCMAYTITALLPRYRINDDLVLCDNHELIPQSWYNQGLLEQVPRIRTEKPLERGTAPQGLCCMMEKLPCSLLNHYDVVWNNDIETTLKHKTNTDFTITCNATCASDITIYAHCETIYNTLKSSTSSSTIEALHADIRFTNQIVIHADRGGTVHG